MKTKRYVRTLRLRDDAKLIAEYRRRHQPGNIWPEIPAGIREVGILAMDIYILGRQLVMILETPEDLDLEAAMTKLAGLPRQQEWEDYMAGFQLAEPGATSNDKWRDMEQMFGL